MMTTALNKYVNITQRRYGPEKIIHPMKTCIVLKGLSIELLCDPALPFLEK